MTVVSAETREVSTPARAAPSKPSRRRYVWAAVVVVVGLLGAVRWSFAILRASAAEADTFPRADVPGTLTAELHPGTWYVYEEAGARVRDVDVTGPDGASVPVDVPSKGIVDFTGYDRGGGSGNAVGVFRLAPGTMGEYTVSVTGTDEFGDGTFAVGGSDVVTFRRNQTAGVLTMLLVTTTTGVAIAVGTAQRRRSRDNM